MTDVMDEAKRLLEIFTEQLVENERLTIKLNAEHLVRQNVEVENAKLRELVRDMLRTFGSPALRVDEIECGTIYAAHIHAFEARMRELGIEVDE